MFTRTRANAPRRSAQFKGRCFSTAPLRAAGADSMHALMPRILAQDLQFFLSGLESSGQVPTKLLLLLFLMGLAPLKT